MTCWQKHQIDHWYIYYSQKAYPSGFFLNDRNEERKVVYGIVSIPLSGKNTVFHDRSHSDSHCIHKYGDHDSVCDSGINVGYNAREQTVGIGESKRYFWRADREYGACMLQSFGDMRNHRYHGLFGAVIVEPAGAKWYENFTKKTNPFAEQAVITAPGMESFREYVLFIQNGIRLLDAQGNLIQTARGL